MNIYEEALKFHKEKKGKYEIKPTCKVKNAKDLSLAYTPGVAEPCREIHKDPSKVYTYTRKWNTVAVVSDGTAVLGLGDIGPLAALPSITGRAARGPISPSPNTAVPSDTTATVFHLRVYV